MSSTLKRQMTFLVLKGNLFVYVRPETDDVVSRTLAIEQSVRSCKIKEGGYYGIVILSSIFSKMNVLRSNISIKRFSYKLL